MTKRLVELGGAPLIQTPEKFGADIAAETEKWKKVIDGANSRRCIVARNCWSRPRGRHRDGAAFVPRRFSGL